ncbi:recombination-associated protein RdgC [Neisseria sp. Ec49-e6-T10]|uniref:recombination-associated protein RdgC n=1 Tax=Neisseria sp. Ec49-e6-T10 TaxID=3140744 RepID=UPI003EBC2AE9
MWFKQLSFYPISKGKTPEQHTLQKALNDAAFAPCQGLEWFSEGFVAPVDTRPEELAFVVQHSVQVALKKEEKVLPSGVINDVLNDKIFHIEQEEARNVGRKEKQALKEQITDDLLPRAFTRSGRTQALFDAKRDFLLINQSTPNKAEGMLSKLRQCLGGLEAALPKTQMSVSTLMTTWLNQKEAAGNFVLDSDCELKGVGEAAATVRVSKQDLTADEIRAHLDNKTVTQLGLIWDDKIRFVLTQDFAFKRIQFLDVLQEEASNEGEDKETLIAASQIIMCESLGQMIEELLSHLGGLETK